MRRLRLFLKVGGILGGVALATGLVVFWVYYWLFVEVPGPVEPARGDTRIVAADGTILSVMLAREHSQPVGYAEISRAVVEAVVVKEDESFFSHGGLDYAGMARAMVANLQEGGVVQGGSTITQQYVKTTLEDRSRTVRRKLLEILVAKKVEAALPKEEILARYLNTIYFGRGAYGIEAAARRYFDVPAARLDYHQAATLAVLISAPSLKNTALGDDELLAQRDALLVRMGELGYLSPEAERGALDQPLGIVPRAAETDVRWPYVVDQVKRELLEVLPPEKAFAGGLTIETTLDPRLQRLAEKAVSDNLPEAEGLEIAVASIDPWSGFVRAMVAGRDYAASQFNLATQARRQPGSAFKPFVLAAALEQGVEVEAPLYLGSTPYVMRYVDPETGSLKNWEVANYEDRAFGRLSPLEATVNSVNTFYAQLVGRVGAQSVVDLARRAGITSPLEPQPAIALGGLETGVSPLEMAAAYSTFATAGTRVEPRHIVRVLDADGEVIYFASPTGEQAIPVQVAVEVTRVLEQVVQRGTGVRAKIDRPAAGKTGTSQDFRDAWFVGYTPELSTAVWMGYPEAALSMEDSVGKAAGGTVPAAVWHDYMVGALDGAPVNGFVVADSVLVSICKKTFKLAVDACDDVEVISLPRASVPDDNCDMHGGG